MKEIPALSEQLSQIEAHAHVRAFAVELAARCSLDTEVRGHYVSLRPALQGAIAVYCNRQLIDISTEPHKIHDAVAAVPGSRAGKDTGGTVYLRVPADALTGDGLAQALQWAETAVNWSATDRRLGARNAERGPEARVGELCLTCHQIKALSGACSCD